MLIPPRKTFPRQYVTDFGSRMITYSQLTIEQQDNLKPEDVLAIIELGEYIPSTRIQKVLKSYFSLRCKAVLLASVDSVMQDILPELCTSYQSIYEGVDTSYEDKPAKRKTLAGAGINRICSEFDIGGPLILVRDYTYEQYGRMVDRLLFDSYESDKKSQVVNDRALEHQVDPEMEEMKELSRNAYANGEFDDIADATFTIEKVGAE